MTEIALLRHFPTDWNAAGRIQGRSDIPLSDMSRDALQTLTLPPPWDDCPVYVSPLRRAQETAHALAGGRALHTVDALTEMDFGTWEGAFGRALLDDPSSGYRPVEDWGWDYRPPNGESPRELASRLRPVLRDLTREPRALVVTHRGVMRAILALATGWAYCGVEPFRIKRAAVHPLRLSEDGEPCDVSSPVKLHAP